MDFAKILEEAVDLKSNIGRMIQHANLVSAKIRKELKGSTNPRYINKELYSIIPVVLSPEKLDSLKDFVKTRDDVREFTNLIAKSLRGYGIKLNQNYINMMIDVFPVKDYSYATNKAGEPYLTRVKATQFQPKISAESFLSESNIKDTLNHYTKWILFRIMEQVPNLGNSFQMAQIILKYMGKELHDFNNSQKSYFIKNLENQIIKKKPDFIKGQIEKYLNARGNTEDTLISGIEKTDAKSRMSSENHNPYLTPIEKYTDKHRNPNGHQHSERRTTGNDTNRKGKRMVPSVRKNLKNPYESTAVNNAQTQPKNLTSADMKEIQKSYGIDFNDRRVKTIKGKTNMTLVPLQNGGWRLEHK